MNNNIKYIVSFVNKRCDKTLCYLLTDFYNKTNKFTKIKREAKMFITEEKANSVCRYIFNYIIELNTEEQYLYFDNIKKSNIKMVVSEYNVIQEERKAKLKKLL